MIRLSHHDWLCSFQTCPDLPIDEFYARIGPMTPIANPYNPEMSLADRFASFKRRLADALARRKALQC